MLAAFDELVDALSSPAVFEFAKLDAGKAASAFGRPKWVASAQYRALGDARFGAFYRQARAKATAANAADSHIGAFAYATAAPTRRFRDVQASGSAYYEGQTIAVDKSRNFYEGDIEIEVRFESGKVSGLVTNLATTADGEPWSHGFGGDVERIFLPEANLRGRTATWRSAGEEARVSYRSSAGAERDASVEKSEFEGTLLGSGDAAGGQAVGAWKIGDGLLAGGFGADRGPDRPTRVSPLVDDVTTLATKVSAMIREPFAKFRKEG